MLGRSLCSVPQANAINPCWCPRPVFISPGSQTFTFLLKHLTLLVVLQSLSTYSLELGRVTVKDSGAFSVFLCIFFHFFHLGNVVLLLEEVVKKVLNLTGLKLSICIDEHNGLLSYYSMKYLFRVIMLRYQMSN